MPSETRQIRWTGEEFVLVADEEQVVEPEAGDVIQFSGLLPLYSEALAERGLTAANYWCMPGSWRMVE